MEKGVKHIVGQLVGLPSTIMGFLNIGVDGSGELSTGLGG